MHYFLLQWNALNIVIFSLTRTERFMNINTIWRHMCPFHSWNHFYCFWILTRKQVTTYQTCCGQCINNLWRYQKWWLEIPMIDDDFLCVCVHLCQGCSEVQGNQEALWPGAGGHGNSTDEERPGAQEQATRGWRSHQRAQHHPQVFQTPRSGLRSTG